MDGLIKKIVSKSQEKLNLAGDYLKDKLTEFAESSPVTVIQLAEYIQDQPETVKVSKEWLGSHYSFYRLEKDDVTYSMEMVGLTILQLDVRDQEQELVSYRSYRNRANPNHSIRIPDKLLTQ